MSTSLAAKSVRPGEAGLGIVLIALAIAWIYIFTGAYTWPYAFHAVLFVLGSLGGVYAIAARYKSREAVTPREIDGRPNYNYGPIKFT